MKYINYNTNRIIERINCNNLGKICRKNDNDFIRNRKITPRTLILYTINNRGKTTKMEIDNFIDELDLDSFSAPALLKQREKLREEFFLEINKEQMERFYIDCFDEVKTFKNHVICAIDGSDCEVPNTKETRERYKSINTSNDERVARIKLSNCYDVINKFVLDTKIAEYKHWEFDLAKKHINETTYISEKFPIIYTMDRGYFSLAEIYNMISNDTKFVIRLNKNFLKKEQSLMSSDDEIVKIQYQYDRIRNCKDKNPEFYNYYENGNTMQLRFVNIELPTGEVETIITNLSMDDFSKEDIDYIYQLRWGVESSYHELKESMKICNISSSKDTIIKQEIYANMFVYNIVSSIATAKTEEIEQERYKHQMKVNFNMAVGYVKKSFIKILIEDDLDKRKELTDVLFNKILKNIVPIRKGRKYERNKEKKNKYPINKRKSF